MFLDFWFVAAGGRDGCGWIGCGNVWSADLLITMMMFDVGSVAGSLGFFDANLAPPSESRCYYYRVLEKV